MTASAILKRAKARIEDPAHWTQGKMAVDQYGFVVPSFDPLAVAWCALGAANCEGVGSDHLYRAAAAQYRGVADINDHEGHVAVMALYDRAISLAEADEAKCECGEVLGEACQAPAGPRVSVRWNSRTLRLDPECADRLTHVWVDGRKTAEMDPAFTQVKP